MWLICKFVVLDMEIGEETLAPVSRKKKDFTEQELIDAMWTKGQYSFKVLKKIYFYDPIIDSKSGNDYLMYEYNTGFLRFGIAVK